MCIARKKINNSGRKCFNLTPEYPYNRIEPVQISAM